MGTADQAALMRAIQALTELATRLGILYSLDRKATTQAPTSERARIQDFLRTGDPAKLNEPSVRAYVGLSMGPHEEVADMNYRRQECRFIFDHKRQVWMNESAVHFPPAAQPYGCDSIVIDGLDVVAKMVARMGSPIMLGPGNAAGYLPGTLSVLPDIMTKATWRDVQPGAPQPADTLYDKPLADWNVEPVSPSVPPTPTVEVKVAPRSSGGAVDLLKSQYPAMNAQAMKRAFQKLMDVPEPPKVEAVPPAEPKHCERCETVTIARRNQLAALGYQVSHLVELPSEAGYAVPCPVCRKL